MPNLFSDLKKQGLWRGYSQHVVALEQVLRKMSKRGIPISKDIYNEVHAKLSERRDAAYAAMQSAVPDEVKPFHPKQGYKKVPKDLTGCVEREFADGKRWVRLDEWSPSSKGLIEYMKFRGHKIPLAMKTKKPTTEALEIKRLENNTGDQLYRRVREYRKVSTVLDNHMVGWAPGEDGRIHPDFYFDPATGQLSSRNPNSQNAPHHDDAELGDFAYQFRRIVAAEPGHTIMEFDYKGFHVQTLGFEARDLNLMRIGRIDLHSFVTSHFLKLPEADQLFGWPDDQLRDFLKVIKKKYAHQRNAQVKHAILGYNNGMGYKKLYKKYMEYFANEKEAKRVNELMDSLFPAAKQYREDICMKAHEQGYLISRHGYIRFFFEVFRPKYGKGPETWQHGDDHEAALCFFTQNDAHGELKDRILTLESMGLNDRYQFINTIHDSLKFHCPDPLVEEARVTVKSIMEAPSPILIDPVSAPNGLVVEVEPKAGPDWSNMKEI